MARLRKEFRDMISPAQARKIIEEKLQVPLGEGEVSLHQAGGRILTEAIDAPIDVPSFARSLMDGYAVIASDVYRAEEDDPVQLELTGAVEMGQRPRVRVERGKAVSVATGAPLPEGANAVVMVERTEMRGGDELLVKRAVAPGENVMNAGSDIPMGKRVLEEGEQITRREISLLAALGREKVRVRQRPRVALFSTGPELVGPGKGLQFGQIYDTNMPSLKEGIEETGAVTVPLGIIPDEMGQVEEAFERALEEADLVISSGGTSAGDRDLIHRFLEEEGEILAHGIKIKPGKPTIIGRVKGKPFFGLPGNPASAHVVFLNFVAPFLFRLTGQESRKRRTVEAHLQEDLDSEGGRYEQKYVGLVEREGDLRAYPVNKVSGAVTLLAQAEGFVEIPEGVLYLERGEKVDVNLIDSELKIPQALVIGSHCLGLEELLGLLSYRVRSLSRGSFGGLEAIERGLADVAGMHILTPSGYNVPRLEEEDLHEVSLVRGYRRRQGLLFPRGNPRNIQEVEDLLQGDLRLINRNAGSGTRALLENLLREAADEAGQEMDEIRHKLPGYQTEVSGHSGVAAAIKGGKADVGLGIETAAAGNGLGFLPLKEENYDFLCRDDFLDTPLGEEFLQIMRGDRFRAKLEELPGLSPGEETGKIIFEA